MNIKTNLRTSLSPKTQILLALVGLGVAACGGDPEGASPATVEARLRTTLQALIDQSFSSAEFLNSSQAWNGLLDSMDTFNEVAGTGTQEVPEPLPAAGEEDPSGEEIADMLIEEIFNANNI